MFVIKKNETLVKVRFQRMIYLVSLQIFIYFYLRPDFLNIEYLSHDFWYFFPFWHAFIYLGSSIYLLYHFVLIEYENQILTHFYQVDSLEILNSHLFTMTKQDLINYNHYCWIFVGVEIFLAELRFDPESTRLKVDHSWHQTSLYKYIACLKRTWFLNFIFKKGSIEKMILLKVLAVLSITKEKSRGQSSERV